MNYMYNWENEVKNDGPFWKKVCFHTFCEQYGEMSEEICATIKCRES